MSMPVERFVNDPAAPAEVSPEPQVSPELVLVSPPELARAAREALADPPFFREPPTSGRSESVSPEPASLQPTHPLPVVAPSPEVPAPAEASNRRRWTRVLLPALALSLAVGGFVASGQLRDRRGAQSTASTPTASQARATKSTSATPKDQTTGAVRRTSPASTAAPATEQHSSPKTAARPSITWKRKPGAQHYRVDIVRGGAPILTILTDEPWTQIPLTWPNAGRRRHLAPGTYAWTVRGAKSRRSAVIAHGSITIH
jgi:hypothetical protein